MACYPEAEQAAADRQVAEVTEDEGRRFIERQWSRVEEGTGYSFAIAHAGTVGRLRRRSPTSEARKDERTANQYPSH